MVDSELRYIKISVLLDILCNLQTSRTEKSVVKAWRGGVSGEERGISVILPASKIIKINKNLKNFMKYPSAILGFAS